RSLRAAAPIRLCPLNRRRRQPERARHRLGEDRRSCQRFVRWPARLHLPRLHLRSRSQSRLLRSRYTSALRVLPSLTMRWSHAARDGKSNIRVGYPHTHSQLVSATKTKRLYFTVEPNLPTIHSNCSLFGRGTADRQI